MDIPQKNPRANQHPSAEGLRISFAAGDPTLDQGLALLSTGLSQVASGEWQSGAEIDTGPRRALGPSRVDQVQRLTRRADRARRDTSQRERD